MTTTLPAKRGPGRPRMAPTHISTPIVKEPVPKPVTPLTERYSLSREDAAIYIGVSITTIDYLLRTGELTGLHIQTRRLIRRIDVEAYIDRKHAEANP